MTIFYDSEPNVFVISGLTSSLNTATTKQISGIYYLTTGATFDFGIGDCDFSNSNSYPANLVSLGLSDFGIPNANLTSADLVGWTNAHDNIDDSWSDTLAISVGSYRLCGGNADFSATPQDWVAGTTQTAASLASLIDTYADNATNGALSIVEQFNGESQRKNSNGTPFDSTATLAANELLVHCGSLMVQQTDFTAYLPHNGTTIINPDYTASGGATQYYYRFYTTDGSTRSGGVFTFGGVTEGDITAANIVVEISLDGTDWYTAASAYLGGALSDGDGCRVPGQTIPNVEVTLGTFTTNDASGVVPVNSMMVRISMPSASAVEVSQMDFVWN